MIDLQKCILGAFNFRVLSHQTKETRDTGMGCYRLSYWDMSADYTGF